MKPQAIDGVVYREFQARADSVDEETREIELTFSSEIPVLRQSWFRDAWIEVLSHDPKDVDLSRLNSKAQLLLNHGLGFGRTVTRLGVVESASIDKKAKRGRARVRFSKRDEVEGEWADVRDGILVNVSVGYRIDERVLTREGKDGEPNEYRVRWTPIEISLVDLPPADHTVGVGRSDDGTVLEGVPPALIGKREHAAEFCYRVRDIGPEGNPGDSTEVDVMKGNGTTTEERTTEHPAPTPTPEDTIDLNAERQRAVDDFKASEKERKAQIRAVFEHHPGNDALLTRCLDDESCDVNAARTQLLDTLARDRGPADDTRIELRHDSVDGFRAGAFLSIAERSSGYISLDGLDRPATNEFRGLTLLELARVSCRLAGLPDTGSKMEIVGRAFTGSGAFQNVLFDAANKSLLFGWTENPETWQLWTRPGNLSDFKIAHRVNLSNFSDLNLIPEGAEYQAGVLEDSRETIQLGTYGRLFPITRQAIINDDLDAFTRVPANMGRAAARVPGDLAYSILTANGNMSDGNPLFDALHANLGTAGAISATTVANLRVLMATQTDPNGIVVGTRLAKLLVPLELEDGANVLRISEFDPADGTNNNRAPNPVRNTFEVVSDHRLSTASATTYYGAADPMQADTVEVAFLDGVQEPFMDEKNGWTVDGVEYKVRLDCGAAATDWRGLTRNTTS